MSRAPNYGPQQGQYQQRPQNDMSDFLDQIEIAPDDGPPRAGRPVLDNMAKLINYGRWMMAAGLVSSSYKSADQVAIAILAGKRLGFDELQSVQNIAVVGQQPRLWGVGLMAVLNREMSGGVVEHFSGQWHLDGDPVREEDVPFLLDEKGSKNVSYTVTHKRKGMDAAQTTYSVEQAVMAGLWWGQGKNRPEESPWRKNPMDMLRWKTRWRAAQADFSDLLMGMAPAEDADIDVTPSATREIRMPVATRPLRAVKPEPRQDVAPEVPAKPVEPTAPQTDYANPITDGQLKMLCTVQADCGVDENRFKDYLAATYEIKSRKLIPRFLLDDVLAWLKEQKPDLAGGD